MKIRLATMPFSALALSFLTGCDGGGGGPIEPPPLSTSNILRVADAAGAPGDTVQISFSLDNPVALAGLQFDLEHDTVDLTVIDAGTAARSAAFEASFHVEGGTAHVLLADLEGLATIGSGEGPVATVTVAVSPIAAGTSALAVDAARAVDLSSTTLTVGGSSATFTVQ